MPQGIYDIIDPVTKNGTELAADLNELRETFLSMHSGASSPAYGETGTMWAYDGGAPVWQIRLKGSSSDYTFLTFNITTGTLALGSAVEVDTSNLDTTGAVTNDVMFYNGSTPDWGRITVALATEVSGVLALGNGGSGKNLSASNGGIVYTDADSMEVLAGIASAGRMLRSGNSAAPTWSTATWPDSGTSGGLLYFSATGAVSSSALLAAAAIVLGGGAGLAPSTNSGFTYSSGNLLSNQDSASSMSVQRNSTDTTSPYFMLYKARGTSASKTTVVTGDAIGGILAYAYNPNAAFVNVAAIAFDAEGTVTGSIVPARMRGLVTNASGTLTERWRVISSGEFGIGRTPTAGVLLDVAGLIRSYDGTVDVRLNGLSTTGYTGTFTNHPFSVYVNSTERVRFNHTTGKVLDIAVGAGALNGIRLAYAVGQTSEGFQLDHLSSGQTTCNIDSLYNHAAALIQIRTRVSGTPVVNMSFLGSGYNGMGGIVAPEAFLHIQSNSAYQLQFLEYNASDVLGATMYMRKSRGTKASPSIPNTNDVCGAVVFQAYKTAGGGAFADGAYLMAKVDGAQGIAGMPVRLEFWSTLGAGVMGRAGFIDSSQRWVLGDVASLTTVKLEVHGGIAAVYDGASGSFGAPGYFHKSQGTLASPTDILAGDSIGTQWYFGYKNSVFRFAGAVSISAQATATNIVQGVHSILLTDLSGNTSTRKMSGAQKTLSDAVAVDLISVPNTAGTSSGFIVEYCIECRNASHAQSETGAVVFTVNRDVAGTTWNNGIANYATQNKVTAGGGTLVLTWTSTSANPSILRVSADTTLTSLTFFRITYNVKCLSSQSFSLA